MIVGITGHRKLGNEINIENKTYNYVSTELIKLFSQLNPIKVITGMALGSDQLAAKTCIALKIPFVAAVPFIDQEKFWPETTKQYYYQLLDQASEVIIVSEGQYSVEKLQIRNEYIVDNSDMLIAIFDGIFKGGTSNCIKYALKINKDIRYINPNAN